MVKAKKEDKSNFTELSGFALLFFNSTLEKRREKLPCSEAMCPTSCTFVRFFLSADFANCLSKIHFS